MPLNSGAHTNAADSLRTEPLPAHVKSVSLMRGSTHAFPHHLQLLSHCDRRTEQQAQALYDGSFDT